MTATLRITPPLADQIAAVNVIAVATKIDEQGQRAAIGASAVDIIAMAKLLMQLVAITDQTYELFETADAHQAERDPEERRLLCTAMAQRIAPIGALLEAIGYGQSPTNDPKKENCNG